MSRTRFVDDDFTSDESVLTALEKLIVRTLNDRYFNSGPIRVTDDDGPPGSTGTTIYTFWGVQNLDTDVVEVHFEHHAQDDRGTWLDLYVQATNNAPIVMDSCIEPATWLADLQRFIGIIDEPLVGFPESRSDF